ncbi:MAG: MBL fold metallo-hydrolase [Erysipelotrichia bacterium]|nr:MBL fold metallo-hydrolase [Erysipelotrichia bacterium]
MLIQADKLNSETLPELPDCRSSDFLPQLVDFGHFLENAVRPGCLFDLKQWPNLLWQKIEAAMLHGFETFLGTKVPVGEVLMLQWYNSGIFVKTAEKVLGFDIIPIPRYYGWPEPEGLTQRIATAVDALFVTHNHQDHYDYELVKACIGYKKPVLMHPEAAEVASGITMAESGLKIRLGEITVTSHHGCHVWRHQPNEVPLAYFEVGCGSYFRFVFCGDADYTKGFLGVESQPDVLFITWRNPGPEYEDGCSEQIATTSDAVNIAISELKPCRIILQHYAELDHVYRGFSASYEMAVELIDKLSLPTGIYFWGNIFNPLRCGCSL